VHAPLFLFAAHLLLAASQNVPTWHGQVPPAADAVMQVQLVESQERPGPQLATATVQSWPTVSQATHVPGQALVVSQVPAAQSTSVRHAPPLATVPFTAPWHALEAEVMSGSMQLEAAA
jgi:hypothetical protein